MKTLRNIFSFVYAIDKGIWREKINPTRYIGTISLMLVLFIGLEMTDKIATGSYDEYYGYTGSIQYVFGGLAVIALIFVINIAEAIVSSTKGYIPAVRALLHFGLYLVFFIIGVLLGKHKSTANVMYIILLLYAITYLVIEVVAAFTVKEDDEAEVEAEEVDADVYEQPAPTPRFCGQCGAPLEPGHQYCGHCGYPV